MVKQGPQKRITQRLHPELKVRVRRKKKSKKPRLSHAPGIDIPAGKKLKNEKWKIIPDTEEKYSVSNFGRVKSNYRRTRGKLDTRRVVLRPFWQDGREELYVMLSVPGRKRINKSVHRLVIKAFLPNYPNYVKPGFRDDDPTNVSVGNIIVPRHRRWDKGKKLSERQVARIKRLLIMGAKVKDLAKRYKVSYFTIDAIYRGRNWKHVKPADFI